MTVRGGMLPPSGGWGVAPLSMTNAADGAVARQCRIADAAFSYARNANIKAARMGEVFGRSWQTGAVNDEVRIKITKCHKRLFNVDVNIGDAKHKAFQYVHGLEYRWYRHPCTTLLKMYILSMQLIHEAT